LTSSDESSADGAESESDEDDALDSIDHYLRPKRSAREGERKIDSFAEVDLTQIPPPDSTAAQSFLLPPNPTSTSAVRRTSLDRIKSRPLQVRDQTKKIDSTPSLSPSCPLPSPIPDTNTGKSIPRTETLPQTQTLQKAFEVQKDEESSHLFSISESDDAANESLSFAFEANELSSHHSGSSSVHSAASSHLEYPFAYQSPAPPDGPSPWVHDYITGVKERHHHSSLLRDDAQLFFPDPPTRSSHHPIFLDNLPPAINETVIESTDYTMSPHTSRNRKPLCRDTLITGREHGIFQTAGGANNYHITSDRNLSPIQSLEKKKLHPLQLALKNNISQLAVPTSAYAPNSLSKFSASPPSNSHSKSLSRESQRTLPSSQRYLIGVTTASASKMKKSASGPMGAVRGSHEWK
jgi:hypothetical protein